jgi:chemotaxis protein MotB
MAASPLSLRAEDTGVVVDVPRRAGQPPPLPDALAGAGLAPTRRRRQREPRSTDRLEPKPKFSVAWVLLALVLGAGALGGFYLFQKWQMAREAAADAQTQMTIATARLADAEQRVIEAKAALGRELVAKQEIEARLSGASERAREADELAKSLQDIVGKQGTVVRDENRLTLELVDKVLFRSGRASLTSRGEHVLGRVGDALRKLPEKQIWVQGHTDDVPISNDEFASNWELSAARALTIVTYLEDEAGIDPRRLAAVAFGEHRPVSQSKRYRNRRIEIVLFPRAVQLIKD